MVGLYLCDKKRDMIRFFTRFVATYGYDSPKEFFLSVAPSFKYNLQFPAISFSAVTAVVSEWIGITPFLAMAMLVAIVSEMWTGIRASKVQGIGFESFRFSRCIIKLCIWLTIIYITHSFYLESKAGHPVLFHCQGVRHDLVLRRARDKHTGEPGSHRRQAERCADQAGGNIVGDSHG